MKIRKMYLNINGVDRMVMCDPENDSLADLLRSVGLTGVKVGCGTGQCGSCSVILDGKVVRSCSRKMKNVPEYSRVVTIEGIGTPTNLHPLQMAWINHGAAQCGFCSPGFIVSAKALLDENPSPTREEVRGWFQKHRNICRCTGYKPLVDAVMSAAEVMRGEKPVEELLYKMPEDGKIYGTAYPRPTGIAKVTGTCDYGDDLNVKLPEGTLHLALVLSRVNRAKILSRDFSEAEKMPGVRKIITYKDVKGDNRIHFPSGMARCVADGCTERPILAEDTVFQYGEVVAMVAASTRREARAAAAKVKIEYEMLPAYMNALDAVADDAECIHPDLPNLFAEQPVRKGDAVKAMEEADVVVEDSFYLQRQPHLVIEPETALAYIDEEGRVTVQSKSLDIGLPMGTLPEGLGIPPEKMRMIENLTGASFGFASSPNTVAIMAVAAMALEEPCALTMSYEEHQLFTGKRKPAFSNMKLGAKQDGTLTAAEFDVLYDAGAYTELAFGISKGARFVGTPYRIPNVLGLTKAAFTNHGFTTAFRAFCSPQVYIGFEQLMDELAEKLGMDPLELRYKNVWVDGDKCSIGHTMDAYPMRELIDRLRPRYQAALERAKRESTPERRRGVGVACGSYNVTAGTGDHSEADLELNADGTVTCYNTWADQGQGGDVGSLVHAHEALRPLGIRPEQIKLVQNDTATCPPSGGAYSSRSHVMIGNAIIDAAEKLMGAMKKPDGSFRTHAEMVAEGLPTRYRGIADLTELGNYDMDPNDGQGWPVPMFSYGIFLAEVEVETATGKTRVLSMSVEGDIGVIGNIQTIEGQAYGGLAQGIGLALSEDFEDIRKHSHLVGAGVPDIGMIPDDLYAGHLETPREHGPQASGGAAELYLTSPHVAIINAIYNACGARIRELPATPDKVKAELERIAAGKPEERRKYPLGPDFHARMEEIKNHPVKRSTIKGFTG